jgi:hypothetical protein
LQATVVHHPLKAVQANLPFPNVFMPILPTSKCCLGVIEVHGPQVTKSDHGIKILSSTPVVLSSSHTQVDIYWQTKMMYRIILDTNSWD